MERWKFVCIGLMPSKDESLMHFVIKLLLERKLLWVFNWTYCNFIFVAWHIIQRNISVHAVIVYFISFNINFFFSHFTLINKDCRCSGALKNGMILREWTWFYNSINSWRVTSLRCGVITLFVNGCYKCIFNNDARTRCINQGESSFT